MRVTADESFTAVIYGGQMLDITKGDVLKGDVANYLLGSGAPVTPDESDEEPAEVEQEDLAEEQSDDLGEELNIDGKIDDVLAWVGDSKERATEARVAEEAKGDKARPRLLSKLAELEA